MEMQIKGQTVEVSKPRNGTRCHLCGEPIGEHGFVKTYTTREPVVYVHKECLIQRGYHETFKTPSGEERPVFDVNAKATTKEQVLFTPEVEFADPYSAWTDERKAHFVAQTGCYVERDCTVGGEAHPLTRLSFHGLCKWYETLSKMVDMTPSNCGHHMNFGWYGMTRENMQYIYEYRANLFLPVSEWLRVHEQETIRIFGRYFDTYCEIDGYSHGSWINLDCNKVRIEFRLPHFASPKQITHCAFLCKEWVKTLRKFAAGTIDSTKASCEMVKALEKHAEGKATYQRPEQNKDGYSY